MLDPLAVIAAWNELMTRRGLARWEPSRRTVEDAGVFLAWCRSRQVDPDRYMRARFDAIGYRHRLSFRQLPSDKFLTKFRSHGDRKQAAAVADERIAARVEDDTPRDGTRLIAMWENAKARFAASGAHEVCRASARTFTGGWQAASVWCGQCPQAQGCARDRSR